MKYSFIVDKMSTIDTCVLYSSNIINSCGCFAFMQNIMPRYLQNIRYRRYLTVWWNKVYRLKQGMLTRIIGTYKFGICNDIELAIASSL